MKINEKIKQLRTENKMTQKEFANKTGLSISAVQKYEYGDLTPSESVLFKISKIFDIDISFFLSNKTNKDFKKIDDFNNQLLRMAYNRFEDLIELTKPFESATKYNYNEQVTKYNYNSELSEFFTILKADGYDVIFSINNLTFSINLNELYNELKPFIEFLLYKHSIPVKVEFRNDDTPENKDK